MSTSRAPRVRKIALCMLVAAAVVLAQDASAAALYDVIDLGTIGGAYSQPLAVNAAGQVVGLSTTAEGPYHAFLYTGGAMQDLGSLGAPGDKGSATAFALNNLAAVVVVGESYTSAVTGPVAPTAPTISTNGGATSELPINLGGNRTGAYGVNDSNVIVGAGLDANGNSQAFSYAGGVVTPLGALGGAASDARGINASGQVTGSADNGDGQSRAYLYTSGTMVDLNTLGGASSHGNALNASGMVAGRSKITGSDEEHAFLFNGTTMIDLDVLDGNFSEAYGINGAGAVVGGSTFADGDDSRHAFLFIGGNLYDLNVLVDRPDLVLTEATGINDAGQIVVAAYSYDTGETHAYLLNPVAVPLPAAAWLLFSGLGGVAAFARRRKRD